MRKTKAAFRALREDCGMTQSGVAAEVGVGAQSVKKWESPNSDISEPPDDVWEWLLATREAIEEEAQQAALMLKRMHRGDGAVALRYYRTQEELDEAQLEAGLDRSIDYVNAVTRRVMRLLDEARIDYDLFYPGEMKLVKGIVDYRE